MKSVNIRSLKHETSDLLERVAMGESVEIRRRNQAIAVIKPLDATRPQNRPDFRGRLQSTYGNKILDKTATELLNEERGDR
jgi:antitoxin (DNA-binding transcriptional repressor) of toxin-antitoxin stability system